MLFLTEDEMSFDRVAEVNVNASWSTTRNSKTMKCSQLVAPFAEPATYIGEVVKVETGGFSKGRDVVIHNHS